ncbi:MAG: PAS domain-containing protein [Gammaproteobacteria bacterium]|nr:PAS domain-containing protein [Gammaproteobacteria bacterium]
MWELNLANGQCWVSKRALEMLGYERDEAFLHQDAIFSACHPEDVAPLREALQHSIQLGQAIDMELRLRTRAAEWRWYRVRGGVQYDATGRATTLSGSQQDITERKHYQQALIAATELAAHANRAKSEFLANMSHEIRTPMNGVIGMSDLLLETALDPLQSDYAQTIRNSAGALLTVINDILDFSKIEAGKLELESLDMDVRGTVNDAARLLAVSAQAKGLAVNAGAGSASAGPGAR